jgi:hypothetical protein
MDHQKLLTLVKRIGAKTDEGQLTWEETEKAGVFQTALSTGSIRLATRGGDYQVTIFNENGSLVETFTDSDLLPYDTSVYAILGRLYETARRQAIGIDKTIDGILEELS